MKKTLFFAAVAALVFASCAKTEIISVNEDAAPAIGFSSYSPRSLTKAGDTYVSGASLVNGKTFAVYAWKTANNTFLGVNPGTPNFMNPVTVTWNNDTTDGDGNTYSPVRYWPAGDTPENLSFAAYYPAGGAGITAPTFASGVGTYAFSAQGTSASMVDFLVADVVNDQVYGETNVSPTYKNTVSFTFKHQLAKVQFKFKKAADVDANTTINLVDAKLYNIQTTGTLTATYAQNASPAVNALGTTTTAWSNQAIAGTPVVYDVFLNGSNPESGSEIELTTTASTVADGDIFLMVPQTMIAPAFSTTPNIPANLSSDAQYLLVTWEVITDGVTTTNTKALYLDQCVTAENGDTQANIDWAKNNFVTYTITIGPKPIWFTGTVSAWDAEQNGYFDVN